MFVKQDKKGAAIFNGLIFVALTAVTLIAVMSMLKFKPVAVGSTTLKATLDLKKEEAAA